MEFELHTFIGIVGYLLVSLGVFHKDDNMTKKFIIAACFLNSSYFFLQALYISSAVAALTGIRIWLSLRQQPHWVGVVFIVITLLTPLYAPSSDYVAMCASLLGVIAVYWFSGVKMRALMLTGTSLWVVNNYLGGAWVGFFGEIFVLSVGITRLILMIKEDSKKQLKTSQEMPR